MALLEARGVEKSYGDRRVLTGLEVSLAEKEILGLIGPNGAGKTTLLRILLGLVTPSAGEAAWAEDGPESALWEARVGHFGGDRTVPPQVSARKWALLVSGGELVNEDKRSVRVLSRGTRQLLGLRAVLSRKGDRALLLDEPWEGLDPDAARWLSATIRERREEGTAFILSSHRLHDLAGLCDRYAFLVDGRLVSLPADEISPYGEVLGEDLLRKFDELRQWH